MKNLEDITRDDLRELLGKGWLTHDGMWFYTVNSQFGAEVASRLNKLAIKAMTPFEVQRLLRILDLQPGEIKDAIAVRNFLAAAMSLILPDSVTDTLNMEVAAGNTLLYHWKKDDCFAYKGMSRIGVIDQYECGVMYRIECWLHELGLQFRAQPELTKCQMREKGYCQGEYELFFA